MLAGPFVILAIPLAASVVATAQAILLCAVLALSLERRIKLDKGLERLRRMRASHLREQAVRLTDYQKQVV